MIDIFYKTIKLYFNFYKKIDKTTLYNYYQNAVISAVKHNKLNLNVKAWLYSLS